MAPERTVSSSPRTPPGAPCRLIADPTHACGGRSLTYVVAVYAVPDLPTDVTGVAATSLPSILAFRAADPGVYTAHNNLDSGSAHLIVVGGDNRQHDSGKVSGERGFSVTLPAGVAALGLKQAPDAGAALHRQITVGRAPAVTQPLQPTTRGYTRRPRRSRPWPGGTPSRCSIIILSTAKKVAAKRVGSLSVQKAWRFQGDKNKGWAALRSWQRARRIRWAACQPGLPLPFILQPAAGRRLRQGRRPSG